MPARFSLDDLAVPIVQAPMAGGPSTVALAAAVCEAGALGFLAAGYQPVDAVERQLGELRAAARAPFGVNVFAPPGPPGDRDAVRRYGARLAPEALRHGVELGAPRHDDDGYDDKLALLRRERPSVVSFTFGCPGERDVAALHDAGSAVWVTVTTPQEAQAARDAGADALVVQGAEAGGHRGSFDDAAPGEIGLLALLQLIGAHLSLPLVATGGIATGRGVAAVLAAGARAAQVGTALMLTPEAATAPVHREALRGDGPTALTRAFSGRMARGIVNRFMRDHEAHAPSAYPEVHHLTTPLRAAARKAGDPDPVNLWAGQAYPLAREAPAADVVRALWADAREALRVATTPGR